MKTTGRRQSSKVEDQRGQTKSEGQLYGRTRKSPTFTITMQKVQSSLGEQVGLNKMERAKLADKMKSRTRGGPKG